MEVKMTFSQKKKITKFYYLIIYLLIYAFLGWLLETAYAFYENGEFIKRGFLYGPICPIYGWGAIILTQFLGKYKNNSIKMFFVSAIVFSAFEYMVGYALDAIFSMKWWDYSNKILNLNGRISIFFSFVWGIFGVMFINHIHPFIKKHVNKILDKIPYIIKINIVRILGSIYIVDTIASLIRYL